jgi:putative membrane protein
LTAIRWTLVAGVIGLEIPYPLVHGHARAVLTIATVGVFAAAAVVNAMASGARRDGAVLLLVVGVGAFAAETLGVHTGYPFGRYHYLHNLGWSLAGVPVVVPLAWVMMAQPSAAIARRLVTAPGGRIIVAATSMAAWDVFLDPQMVSAHHWRWLDPDPHLSGVHDVPLSNLGGWLLVSLLLMAVLHALTRDGQNDPPSLVLWTWTWLGSTLANLAFFGRPAVGAWGFVAMGLLGIPLLVRIIR